MEYGDARLPERFWRKVEQVESGCWLWTASTRRRGYGQFWWGERVRCSHIVPFEVEYGSIPEGLELDHLCRTPLCCNPAHLEAVTHRENLLRGETLTAAHARRTHCARGHEFAGENLVHRKDGTRMCRECNRIDSRRHQAARRARLKAAADPSGG